jgi:integrase
MSQTIDVLVKVPTGNGKRTTWQRLASGAKAPAGARYEARWRSPDGATRSKRFDRKIDAQRHLDHVAGSKLASQYVDPGLGRVTFAVYAEGWLDRKRASLRPSTVQVFTSHLHKHLLPAFGQRQLASITREQCKAFALGLSPGVKPTTARAITFTLAAILREAIDDGRLSRNPAERIGVGKASRLDVDPRHIGQLSTQVDAIAAAMPPCWRAAVVLMATTGLRLSECHGLTVDRVDWLRRSIRVDRQLVGSGFGPPKTASSVRTIPVPQNVIDLLAAHLAEFPAGRDGLIFTAPATRQSSAGRPIGRSAWSDRYREACRSAGVDGRTRSHDLRHVAASALINSGLSVSAVQAVLGHASASETLNTYTHLWPTDEDRTRAAIEHAAAGWSRPSSTA